MFRSRVRDCRCAGSESNAIAHTQQCGIADPGADQLGKSHVNGAAGPELHALAGVGTPGGQPMQRKLRSFSRRSFALLALLASTLTGGVTASATTPAPASNMRVGAPIVVENLSLFPLHATHAEPPIALTTLEAALAKGEAEISEVDGGEVNRLQIHNKGKLPIYVLAGTVVEGGKQDRQIGQDFVIEQGKKVAVDAFCVEQGRWTAERGGHATGGKFKKTKGLALSAVRRAGQYEQDQSAVWNQVSEVNAAHKKSAASGTLMATLDATDVAQGRTRLVRAIDAALRSAEAKSEVVGLAYAIDGEVRNVRWFQSASAFALFRTTLLESAALDALTAQARGSKREAPAVEAAAVERFVQEVESGSARTRDTDAQNRNEYREGKPGYGAKTRLKSAPASAAPISSDYTAK
jgi:hypothetical protein